MVGTGRHSALLRHWVAHNCYTLMYGEHELEKLATNLSTHRRKNVETVDAHWTLCVRYSSVHRTTHLGMHELHQSARISGTCRLKTFVMKQNEYALVGFTNAHMFLLLTPETRIVRIVFRKPPGVAVFCLRRLVRWRGSCNWTEVHWQQRRSRCSRPHEELCHDAGFEH